jgi:hypothetical protein
MVNALESYEIFHELIQSVAAAYFFQVKLSIGTIFVFFEFVSDI